MIEPIVLFGIQFTFTLIVSSLIARWYVAPRLSRLSPELALVPLLWVHAADPGRPAEMFDSDRHRPRSHRARRGRRHPLPQRHRPEGAARRRRGQDPNTAVGRRGHAAGADCGRQAVVFFNASWVVEAAGISAGVCFAGGAVPLPGRSGRPDNGSDGCHRVAAGCRRASAPLDATQMDMDTTPAP
jgi:hypothetical protein